MNLSCYACAMNVLEEGNEIKLDFSKLVQIGKAGQRVVPVAVQNYETQEVILIAYVNQQALDESIKQRSAVFWSTSRDELWEKGKTSGETFELIEIRVNCEQNSLVYKVKPRRGNICHTKNKQGEARNCYYRKVDLTTMELVNEDP